MDKDVPNTDRKPPFEEAARGAYPRLFKAALVLVDSQADAEDAVQETLVKAWRYYEKFRGESSAMTWMYRILVTEAARSRRKRKAPAALDAIPETASAADGPDATAELDEQSRAVLAALRRLPRRQREIVSLFYLEELAYAEIAAALGVSVGTVKSTLHNAREAMRAALGVGERLKECRR